MSTYEGIIVIATLLFSLACILGGAIANAYRRVRSNKHLEDQ